MSDSIAVLEEWVYGHKARSVCEISRDNGYGASCWEVVLCRNGETPEGWAKHRQGNNERFKYVFAYEAQFWTSDTPIPPNVVYVMTDDDDDWPGLGPTILAAVKRAKELGL